MYLRKNKVRCGDTKRSYLSIAHNVWWPGEEGKRAQSRPVVIANLGLEDRLDMDLVHDVVVAVENSSSKHPVHRGGSREATMKAAQEIRKIESFLKVLASRKLGLSQHLPPPPVRQEVLEALIRNKLTEPDSSSREHEILEHIRSQIFGF